MKSFSKKWTLGTGKSVAWPAGVVGEVVKEIKDEEKKYRDSCESMTVPAKHKYCFILGRSKKETKQLHKLFKDNNPKKVGLPYPKEKLDNKSNLGISSAGKTSKFEIIYMNLFLYRQVGILSTLI